MAELTKERLYDAIVDILDKQFLDSSTANIHITVDSVAVSPDGFDDNQKGILVTGTNGKTFTIIIIDDDEE